MHKVTRLSVKNIGLIDDCVIELNKHLLLFYGEIRQGKTTLLNSVKWVLGAAWPDDIIRHGEAEASVKLEFVGGSVSRSWYQGRDGTTKARDIALVIDNQPVAKPVKELAKFLNPFLLNQDHLRNMTEPERKAFFADILAVDTSDLDMEATVLEGQARELRAEIKAYGDLADFNPIPLEKLDVQALYAQRQAIIDTNGERVRQARANLKEIQDAHNKECDAVRARNRIADEKNRVSSRAQERIETIDAQIAQLQQERMAELARIAPWETIAEMPPDPDTFKFYIDIDTPADTKAIDQQIQEAGARNALAEQWARDNARVKEKEGKESDLQKAEARLRAIKAEKAAKLKDSTDSCGVPGLAFDELGQVIYEGTQAGMLSTSQIMKLSSHLSALYPPGFGLDLIDRAESLGQSIYQFIERAQREDKTILATIVGEAPAKSPPEVGVFVVEKGKIKKQKELL